MYEYESDKFTCDDCGRFIRKPYDSSTPFGCANPESPEPYDPEHFCKKCAKKLYESFLKSYSCCGRSGDWQKSDAEIRAAKECNLVWMGESGFDIRSGRYIYQQYMSQWELKNFMGYGEYEKKRRDEGRCRCWRKKNAEGNCERCNHGELHCLCWYDNGILF